MNNEEKKSKEDPVDKCEKKENAQKSVQNVGNPEDKRRVEVRNMVKINTLFRKQTNE